jgi:methionyl-tRNA formyltransferase
VTNKDYLVAGCKPWNRRIFDDVIATYPGDWHYIDDPVLLTMDNLAAWLPRYVFFLHWSWKVPQDVLAAYECVCFHMTDVPFGRGGSPLQNLILRGLTRTKVSALRMTGEMDAGPVYMKEPLSLSGRAQEIFERCAELVLDMAEQMAERCPEPVPQNGEVVTFSRRTPPMSRLPESAGPDSLHDFIRMLDADTYPPAFIEHGDWRIEFTRSRITDGTTVAEARFVRRGNA